MKIYSLLARPLAVLMVLPSLAAFAQKPRPTIQLLETFDLPLDVPSTQGINQRGDIVGYGYKDIDRSSVHRGFVRFRNGATTIFNFPGFSTYASEINTSGTVCGYYSEPRGILHGWFFTGGVYSTFDIPGATSTSIFGLNDAGDFVGNYTLADSQYNPFLDSGGTVIPIDVGFATDFTTASAVSSDGTVVGYYQTTPSSLVAGFIRATDGTITSGIQDPDAVVYGTYCYGINFRGWVVGTYTTSFFVGNSAFLFKAPNQFINYSIPAASITVFSGINDQGRICGFYINGDGSIHGIILQVME
jgi:hypothetical protein